MRFVIRLAIVLGAIVIFSGGFAAGARAQDFAPLFQQAEQREKEGKKQDALNAYSQVVRENQGKNTEAAAEALYRGGVYAVERYGATDEEKRHGEEMAVQMWKQLQNDYPLSKAAQRLAQERRFIALTTAIDKRNSSDWKYQLIDSLVRLTGKNPNYSYGLALILLAVCVKLILMPLTMKQYAAMREMQRMQPYIKELQAKYKGAELSQKQMDLYKEHKVNPFASCFPTLLMMPFLIFIFTAIREYEFAFMQGKFLWIGSSLAAQNPHLLALNLASPDVPLLVMYVLTNYITMRMTPATDPQQQQQQSTMALMTSGLFFWMFLSYKWSSAFVLYWLAQNLISIWQQYEYVYKPNQRRSGGGTGGGGGLAIEASKNGVGSGAAEGRPLSLEPPARVRPRKKKR